MSTRRSDATANLTGTMWLLACLLLFSSGTMVQADQPAAIADTEWRLLEFRPMNDASGILRPHDPSLYVMRLQADGRVTMQLNCNRATGTWSAQADGDGLSGTFRFGLLATTRALCPPPSMDEHFINAAPRVRGFLLREGVLHLGLQADAGVYAWTPVSSVETAAQLPAESQPGAPRNWVVSGVSSRLNLRDRPSTTAAIVATYRDGDLLDNLGCANAEGRVWCDVQAFGGGPRGYVAAEFLRPAVSPDGAVARGPDDSARRAGQGQFDATGDVPCAQFEEQPMTRCTFGVSRSGGGDATIVIQLPGDRARVIFFRMGTPTGTDGSQADGYPAISATKKGDLHRIRVGAERYEIPDAVILGG